MFKIKSILLVVPFSLGFYQSTAFGGVWPFCGKPVDVNVWEYDGGIYIRTLTRTFGWTCRVTRTKDVTLFFNAYGNSLGFTNTFTPPDGPEITARGGNSGSEFDFLKMTSKNVSVDYTNEEDRFVQFSATYNTQGWYRSQNYEYYDVDELDGIAHVRVAKDTYHGTFEAILRSTGFLHEIATVNSNSATHDLGWWYQDIWDGSPPYKTYWESVSYSVPNNSGTYEHSGKDPVTATCEHWRTTATNAGILAREIGNYIDIPPETEGWKPDYNFTNPCPIE